MTVSYRNRTATVPQPYRNRTAAVPQPYRNRNAAASHWKRHGCATTWFDFSTGTLAERLRIHVCSGLAPFSTVAWSIFATIDSKVTNSNSAWAVATFQKAISTDDFAYLLGKLTNSLRVLDISHNPINWTHLNLIAVRSVLSSHLAD